MGKGWASALTWAVGAAVSFALRDALRRWEERRTDSEEQSLRADWVREERTRLDLLLTSATDETEQQAHPPSAWGPPEGAAWLDVLLGALWRDVLCGLVEHVTPSALQEVLNAYAQERDVVPIPSFITHLVVASFSLGKAHCPVATRAVRACAPGVAAHGDTVLDVDVEALSSDMNVTLHAVLNDGVAPLLRALGLREEDDSYLAITVTDVRFVGTLRARLSPSARIASCGFTAPPAVSLGLAIAYHSKLGFHRSLPLSALPGVPAMLELLVQAAVAEYALWPRCFCVDLAPPLLLRLPRAGERAPHGELRLTLLEARGLMDATVAPATAAAACAPGREAAPAGPLSPATAAPFATVTWGLEMKRLRLDAADAPPGEDGSVTWGGGSGCTRTCDVFAPLGIDFCTLALHVPGRGRVGAAQVKLQTLGTGETLFSWASAQRDEYSNLPCFAFGMAPSLLAARYDGLLPGRSSAPCVVPCLEDGSLEMWVPLDGSPHVELRVRLAMDWRYVAASQPQGAAPRLSSAPATAFSDAVGAAEGQALNRDSILHVSFGHMVGLPSTGMYALSMGRPDNWRASPRTRSIQGGATSFHDALELRVGKESPVVTLLLLRPALHAGHAEEAVASASVPSSQLSRGHAASVWLPLKPTPGLAPAQAARFADVRVLLRLSLCADE